MTKTFRTYKCRWDRHLIGFVPTDTSDRLGLLVARLNMLIDMVRVSDRVFVRKGSVALFVEAPEQQAVADHLINSGWTRSC